MVSFIEVVPDSEPLPTWARIAIATGIAYLLGAYVILPRLWKHHEERLSKFRESPRVTHTASDIPGDPLNIALVGTEEDLIRAMNTARWNPANPLTFRSSVRIVIDTMLRKPDDEAPVSNLYLFGRKEDLAFEKPVGSSPKERHHVRFWRMAKTDDDRPAWIGSAAYDIGVELSRTTGQVTHHISPNLDAERDLLVTDLTKSVSRPGSVARRFPRQIAGAKWGRRSVADGWPFGRCHPAPDSRREQPDPEE